MRSKMKKMVLLLCIPALLAAPLSGCEKKEGSGDDSNLLVVYNYGEYLDPEVIDLFEEETGYKVLYDVYETNEIMYPKVAANPSQYDVICPSDYMVTRMAEEGLIAELDMEALPNAKKYIGQEYWKMSESFDPGNRYSVPYLWGTVGIMYNRSMVDEEVRSWDILWDPKYYDNILMQDSMRDLFAVALKKLGYSLNTTDLKELQEAKELLIEQKPLVQAYVVDEVRDKMIAGESALGVIYSGEAEYSRWENEDLAYCIPEEGTNVWIDSWVMTKESRHKKAALEWIDFLCRPEIALMNFEFIYYSTPNTGAMELMEEELLENDVLFPDLSKYKLEPLQYLGKEAERMYYNLWKEIKSA